MGDDSSVCSTPVKGTDVDLDVPLRKTLSSDQLTDDEVVVNKVIDQFMKSQRELDNDALSEAFSSPMHELQVSVSCDKPPQRSPHVIRHLHRSSYSWDNQSFLGGPRAPMMMERDPKRRHRKVSSKGSGASPSRAQNRSSPSHRRSESSPSHRRTPSKNGSRGSYSSGELIPSDGECLYIYEASHRGYLGLSIEPCKNGGTQIRAVKEYSPFFGLVEVGDCIVDVDGVETTHKSTVGVADLLRRTKGRTRKIRITVSRAIEDFGGIPTLPVVRSSRSKSIDSFAVHVPANLAPVQNREPSPVADLDTSSADRLSPAGSQEEPFHFLGATAYEDEEFPSCFSHF